MGLVLAFIFVAAVPWSALAIGTLGSRWRGRAVVRLHSLTADASVATQLEKSVPVQDHGLDGDEQTFETAFAALTTEEDPTKFVATLKLWASKRAMLTSEEKLTLIDSTLSHMEHLSADLLSNCVWSLGVIGYSIDWSSNSKDNTEVMMLSDNVISNMMSQIDRVTSAPLSTEILCRVIGGLSKMGYQWSALPVSLKGAAIDLLVSYSEKPKELTNGEETTAAVHLKGKDIAIMCYTLGQLKARKRDVGKQGLRGLLNGLKSALHERSVTNQGLVNSLNGLQRMGLSWDDDLPASSGLRSEIIHAAIEAVESMRQDEVCSLLHSLANLRASWSDSLPNVLQTSLSNALEKHAPTLNNREIANAHWALGKLHYPYASGGKLEHILSSMLVRRAHTFNQYDVESTFVGLGLMRASFADLPSEAQAGLLGKVGAQADTMNIFELYNILWGMARVGITIDSPALSEETARKLWERTIAVFHTFLRRHYGDVMWALGSLGFSFDAARERQWVTENNKQRLLAILTRVFVNFDTREAAYALWGLARMGVSWDGDMSKETLSTEKGVSVAPMAKIVALYLKRQQFREHDYAVLLYSLGALGVRFHDNLSTGIVVKLNRVAPFVSSHFTSRSLSSALDGLATCGAQWGELAGGEEVKEAYMGALVAGVPVGEEEEPAKGLHGMNALELTKTFNSLAKMGVKWDKDLSISVQQVSLEVLGRERDDLTDSNLNIIKRALESMEGPSFPAQ